MSPASGKQTADEDSEGLRSFLNVLPSSLSLLEQRQGGKCSLANGPQIQRLLPDRFEHHPVRAGIHNIEQAVDTWVQQTCAWVAGQQETICNRSKRLWHSWAAKRASSVCDSRARERLNLLLVNMGQLHVLQEYLLAYINEWFVDTRQRLHEIVCRLSLSFGFGWFFEWPGGRRPLNSTWPWADVKPSLLVLWGVCWMFNPMTNNNWRGYNDEIERRAMPTNYLPGK